MRKAKADPAVRFVVQIFDFGCLKEWSLHMKMHDQCQQIADLTGSGFYSVRRIPVGIDAIPDTARYFKGLPHLATRSGIDD